VLRDHGARVAVALAVGCGLLPCEILAVAVVDLDLKKHVIIVHGLDRSDAPRVMPLAPWVEDLLRDYIATYARQGRPQSPWLFPGPRDPRRPRGDFGRLLQSAHKRAGAGLDHHPPATLRDLRRTSQWAILRAGLPAEAVRGTWSMQRGEWPPWWPALQRLVRQDWTTLTGLDRERWPRGCASFVRSSAGLLPADVAEARRKLHKEPPPLPASSAASP
jgi:integrase